VGESEPRYSIRIASRLTAIELGTLRVWERRYGFPRPDRTSGGARMYSQADVEALKLIRRALELGYRPGDVVGKSSEELGQLIIVASQAPSRIAQPAPTVDALLRALGKDDVATLRAGLQRAAAELGPRSFVVQVAQPLSVRVGELWSQGALEVRHEHLLTECLSAQLTLLSASQQLPSQAPRVLLATLPNERHGLGLEMIEVYLGTCRVATLSLGVDAPPEQIVDAARGLDVDAVGLLVTLASDLKASAKQLRWMVAELPRKVAIWIGGGGAPELDPVHEAVRVIVSWSDLDAAVAGLHPEVTMNPGVCA
jgi:methanogenic corrinoid protein MtbC1